MTFPLQKPAGWIDDVDAIEAPQVTNIDANLSSALDGAAGGDYAPSGVLSIGGGGLVNPNCGRHNVRGPYQLGNVRASIQYRVDRTTIDPASANTWTIDTSSDIYIVASPCLLPTVYTVSLNITDPGKEKAKHGDVIIIRKDHTLPLVDDASLQIKNGDSAPQIICALIPLTSVQPPNSNFFLTAEFVFDGNAARWIPKQMSEQSIS